MNLGSDYETVVKKKKKHDKEKPDGVKAKPLRNFKIIDDDIDINKLTPNEETDALVDLLDHEGPSVADYSEIKSKIIEKVDVYSKNKWIKVDLCENDDGDITCSVEQDEKLETFKKRSAKPVVDDDDDLDMITRRRSIEKESKKDDSDIDLSPIRRRPKEEEIDETKVRQRRLTQKEIDKKARQEEKKAKYEVWGKGVIQQQQKEEKLKDALYEVDKPLARYQDDKDLEELLRKQEREDDPMLEYLKNKSSNGDGKSGVKKVYRGPPPPPNRYAILPGPRWDGVDRSNGFEKKYYESITAKKVFQEEAYKWSTEDM